MTRSAWRFRIALLLFCAVCAGALPARAQYLAYVVNQADNTVSVIDTATAAVVATVPVGNSPGAVAVTSDGAYAYVLNNVTGQVSSTSQGSVSVISALTKEVVATIPVGTSPFGITIAPNGLYAYVTNAGDGTISVIDTSSNTVTETIPGGRYPCYVAFTQAGAQAYVSQCDASPILVIDTATNAAITTISTLAPSEAEGPIVVAPDGATAYVPLFFGYVAAIDTATNTVTTTWSLNGGQSGIDLNYLVVTPDGGTVYITAQAHNNVIVIPTATGVASGTISVGSRPGGLAITADGSELYAANRDDGTISVIQVSTNTVIGTIAVGNRPLAVAFAKYPVTTPTITWPTPAAITYGTPLGATQLDATASVPGTFAYSPAAGTVLQPGTHTLSVTFTPTDLTDYTTATANVSISVEYGVCLLYDSTKSVHSGAAYPIKLYLCDANGTDVSSATVVLHATDIIGVAAFSGDVEDTGNANPDNDFRFDGTLGPSGGYIFNLGTNGLSTGTYSVQFTVGNDPVVHAAIFGVK